jgi:hypothetical protein
MCAWCCEGRTRLRLGPKARISPAARFAKCGSDMSAVCSEPCGMKNKSI